MSYDLQFFKQKTHPLKKEDIEKYLSEIPNISQEDESEWVYQNPDTEVYCVFSFNEFDEEEEHEEEDESHDGFENTDLSFMINFNRPDFFGKECFPLVDKLVEKLDLYIINPQGDGSPQKYAKGHLENEWSESNSNFAKYFFKETEIGSLGKEKSNYSWRFLFNKSELQNELGEEYFVPRIFFLQKWETREVETFCVWPQHIPIALPKVDYVVIQREKKKLFRTKREDGVVTYSEIMAAVGSFFKDRENYKLLEPEDSDKIAEKFNQLSLGGQLDQYGELIRTDGFININ